MRTTLRKEQGDRADSGMRELSGQPWEGGLEKPTGSIPKAALHLQLGVIILREKGVQLW